MSGPGTPAIAMLVALVVVVCGVSGIVHVDPRSYVGLILLIAGIGVLAWGREEPR